MGSPESALAELKRPAYQIRRFDEDWSVLRGVDLSATGEDRLKFIPLTRDESVWLSLGGQVRERAEYYRHYLFGASKQMIPTPTCSPGSERAPTST